MSSPLSEDQTMITPAPEVTKAELRRQLSPVIGDQTCGYIEASSILHAPFQETPTGAAATPPIALHRFIARTKEDQLVDQIASTPQSYHAHRVSTGASATCVTYIRATALTDSSKMTSWACGQTAAVITVFADAATTAAGSGDVAASTSTVTTGSSTDGATTDTLSRPAEIGTIVSTVFGGLCLVAALIFGINGWRRRRARHP
ncbi:hypothetical protein MMC27_004461 [Xylographa pallens]|nr:hypothetical protein [Xylographa pallens]